MNFFRTMSSFYKNPFINPYCATIRHAGWAFRKLLNLFPYDIKIDKITVRIADRSIANGCGALINAMGYYDPNNMRFMEYVFQSGIYNTFFDVGANIGIYSLIAANQSPNSRVFAFEPHPVTFSFLMENVRINFYGNQIKCFQFALGDSNTKTLFRNSAGDSTNRVIKDTDENIEALEVILRRGDSFCAEMGIVPQVMKIDVEGYENQVLTGFANVIDEVQLVFVESWEIETTGGVLKDLGGFLGPFKVDYRKRRFVSANIHFEDWLFVNPQAANLFKEWLQ
jgi:FkbM family methyltransferase